MSQFTVYTTDGQKIELESNEINEIKKLRGNR